MSQLDDDDVMLSTSTTSGGTSAGGGVVGSGTSSTTGGMDIDLKDTDKSDSDFDEEDNENELLGDDSILRGTPINGIWKPHYGLYLHTVISQMTERMCEFAIIYCLAFAFKNSFVFVGAFGLIPKVMRLIFNPQMNNLIGKYGRLTLMTGCTALHGVSLILVVSLVLVINSFYAGTLIPWSNSSFVVTFVVILLSGIFVELTDLLSSLSLSTDWVHVIANSKHSSNNPTLAEISDTRIRFMLMCKVLAPLICAAFFYFTTLTVSLFLVIGLTFLSGFVELFLLNKLQFYYPELATGRVAPSSGFSGERIDDSEPLFSIEPLTLFYSQSSFLSSCGAILLAMSVLVPGCLITNYLVYRDISIFEIASLQSTGVGVGIFGAFTTPKMIDWIGLSKCALVSVWFYFVLMCISYIQVVIPSLSVWLLIIPMAISRIFYWTFDLTEKQILKESCIGEAAVLESVQVLEFQLATLSSLLSCAFAILSVEPSHFIFLAGATLGISFFGVSLFTLWYRTHGHSHELSTILG